MCTKNIKELRNEAYKLWGIGNKPVVYDFPQQLLGGRLEFSFKLDYSFSNASWPRAYSLAIENGLPNYRIIMPITAVKSFDLFTLEYSAWYDMPINLHTQMVDHIIRDKLLRPMSWRQKIWNWIVPRRFEFDGRVPVEDYIFNVSYHHEELILDVV